MPLTALHDTAGLVDLTLAAWSELADPLVGADIRWSQVHNVRPRALLSCRGCGHGLHAKISVNGLRFFAHDANAPDCSLRGESLEHRLLKLELAGAVRDAGWHAELEVAGEGWRADVLATGPGGEQMAWEAQLFQATAASLEQRTRAMANQGVAVCWVVDCDRPFIGHVPTIRVQRPAEDGDAWRTRVGYQPVIDGLGVFDARWCPQRNACAHAGTGRLRGDRTCLGHGSWSRPEHPPTLNQVVGHVLNGRIELRWTTAPPPPPRATNRPGPQWWTTRRHLLAEDEELRVRKEHPLVGYRHPLLGLLNELDDDHAANVVALVARQEALRPRAKVAMSERHGREARVLDGARKWAYGVPVVVDDTTVAVLCPIAGRIDPDAARRLSQVEVVATTEPERQRIARACAEAQTVTVVPVDAAEFRKHRSLISLWSRSA